MLENLVEEHGVEAAAFDRDRAQVANIGLFNVGLVDRHEIRRFIDTVFEKRLVGGFTGAGVEHLGPSWKAGREGGDFALQPEARRIKAPNALAHAHRVSRTNAVEQGLALQSSAGMFYAAS